MAGKSLARRVDIMITIASCCRLLPFKLTRPAVTVTDKTPVSERTRMYEYTPLNLNPQPSLQLEVASTASKSTATKCAPPSQSGSASTEWLAASTSESASMTPGPGGRTCSCAAIAAAAYGVVVQRGAMSAQVRMYYYIQCRNGVLG